MRVTKSRLLGLLLAGVVWFASPHASQAASCSASAVVITGGFTCTTTGATLGGIDTLQINSITMPVGISVAMTVEEFPPSFPSPALISVVFSFRNAAGATVNLLASAVAQISYQITQTYSELQQVGLSTNGTSSWGNVKETLNPQNFIMTSTNSSPVGPLVYEANHQFVFTVVDDITVSARSLASITNDFYVPEPASLAILGAGLCGLGWARRRRRD